MRSSGFVHSIEGGSGAPEPLPSDGGPGIAPPPNAWCAQCGLVHSTIPATTPAVLHPPTATPAPALPETGWKQVRTIAAIAVAALAFVLLAGGGVVLMHYAR